MDGYLFDASALSAYMNEDHQHHESTLKVIDNIPDDALKFVSVITLGEFEYGVRSAEYAGSVHLAQYRRRLDVIRRHQPLDLTRHTSDAYGELKARLASRVLPRASKRMPRWIEDWLLTGSAKSLQTDENDLWICAQAKERDLIVVTGDIDILNLSSVDSDLRILFTRP